MEDIDIETQAPVSTLGTGGGTDHDDSVIRPRPMFRWEGILSDPLVKKAQVGNSSQNWASGWG
jgi:hypothetical protein